MSERCSRHTKQSVSRRTILTHPGREDQTKNWNRPTSIGRAKTTRSSSLVTLLHPKAQSSLKITNRSFRYAAPHLWNKLPPSIRVPCHSATSECSPPLPGSDSAPKSVVGVSHRVFHSRLKTHLFSNNSDSPWPRRCWQRAAFRAPRWPPARATRGRGRREVRRANADRVATRACRAERVRRLMRQSTTAAHSRQRSEATRLCHLYAKKEKGKGSGFI